VGNAPWTRRVTTVVATQLATRDARRKREKVRRNGHGYEVPAIVRGDGAGLKECFMESRPMQGVFRDTTLR
jgi:hypothetical protein